MLRFNLVLALLVLSLTFSGTLARFCQCTDYVAEHYNLGSGWGTAKDWGPFLRGKGFSESDTPAVGAIVVQQPCFGHGVNGEFGHVGWVSAWSGSKFTITGANQGCTAARTSWNSGCRDEGTCDDVSDWYGLPLVPGCAKFYYRGVPPPASPVPAPLGSSYVGCFVDAPERDLNGPMRADADMTIEKCRGWCAEQGFEFAGLQYTSQCFCDHDYGLYGRVNDGECAMQCGGSPSERCGNGWRNSVYRTGGANSVPATSPPTPPQVASFCTTAGLRLRSCAGTSCGIITTIPAGQRVTDLGQSLRNAGGLWWRNIAWNGASGWSADEYIDHCTNARLESSSRAVANDGGSSSSGAPAWLVPVCVISALGLVAVVVVAVVLLVVVLPRRNARKVEQKKLDKVLFESIVEPPMGYRSNFSASG
jgi:surface antigen